MFKKILIANRGEIACRIIRSCNKLGISTVAVHSEADADALHARMADEAILIGPAQATESYLRIEGIIEACRTTGAEAIHPGYGFLSENARFVEAVEAAGLVFIGPPAPAVRAMGDKIESKRLAQDAGVSTVPGHPEAIDDPDEARKVAEAIGFPVIIKAAAGGGGKGMRIVNDAQELQNGLARTQSEAQSSFGDGRVFLEKYITRPRHIEIQVLADRHGNAIHLGERECSVQRRHQKVLEEAPSPFVDPKTRAAMGEQAVSLARRVGYVSAGTVEFIADAERNFYFLEMNTRLQVEHPVTEIVTGLDLVEAMIRIAAGETLPLAQENVRLEGWALEARLYAEDPARGFLPSVGRLNRYQEPERPATRVDSGVEEGSEISIHYDPMIAKLITSGNDRDTALERMRLALESFVIRGVQTNASFLAATVAHPTFMSGDITTNFIDEHFKNQTGFVDLDEAICADIASVVLAMVLKRTRRAAGISGQVRGWNYRHESQWCVLVDETPIAITCLDEEHFLVGGSERTVVLDWRPGNTLVRARINSGQVLMQADPINEGYIVRHKGAVATVVARTRQAADFVSRMPKKAKADQTKRITSPMPGLILSIAVSPGDVVEAGQEVCVLEAMKMENVLRAHESGKVAEIKVKPRDAVGVDQVLLTFV